MNTRFVLIGWALTACFWAAANNLPVTQFLDTRGSDTNLADRLLPGQRNGAEGPKSSLILMLKFGDTGTNAVNVNDSRGVLAGANGVTNRVDVLAAEDKSAIVFLAGNDGPVYYSTNFGFSWSTWRGPGTNDFPLTSGFYGQATLPDAAREAAALTNWLAASDGSDGARLFMGNDPALPTPAISVVPSGGGCIAAWPTNFGPFVLQTTPELANPTWSNISGVVSTNHGENEMYVAIPAGTNYYRLASH